MIKINLLGDEGAADHSDMLWIGGFLGSIALMVGFCFILFQSVQSSIGDTQETVAGLEQELARLQEVTKEVRDFEKKRAELNDKLAVLAKLKKSKLGPVRVLDDLNVGIPERAWLMEAKEKSGLLKISGFALDNQTIADFMRGLEKSEYFSEIELVEAKQSLKKDVKVKSFVLSAQVNYAGKLELAAEEEGEKDGKKKKKA